MTDKWDPSLGDYLEKVYEHLPKNLDHNSGNPLGVSICQVGAHDGARTTADGAFLSSPPSNLTVQTDSAVSKILFDGQKAIGVQVAARKSTLPPFVSPISRYMKILILIHLDSNRP